MAPLPARGTILAVALGVIAVTLQGCFEDGTCMWNGDVQVKGCRYNFFHSWSSCIEHCNGCFNECNKLKCAAYCAKASGNDECLANYESLCTSAIQNVDRVGQCDVDCSSAKPRAGTSLGLAHVAPALGMVFAMLQVGSPGPSVSEPAPSVSAARRQRRWPSWMAASAVLLFMACLLSGCCHDPAPQLPEWTPNADEFNRLAERVDESGLWRGTGFQVDPPGYIESEQYHCTNRTALTGGFCGSWHKQESNCRESEFGKCLCLESSASKHFCRRWTCKDLEADQFICHYPLKCHSTDSGRRRGHRRLGEGSRNAQESAESDDEGNDDGVAVSRNFSGVAAAAAEIAEDGSISEEAPETDAEARRLHMECHREKECLPSAFQMNEEVYKLLENHNIKFSELGQGARMWAVIMHDPSLMGWLQTQSLCLTPGDFEGTYEDQYHSQMKYCRGQRYFREIEEEGSTCHCLMESFDNKRCEEWKCVEHKNGLFGILFERPPPNFEDLVDGLEIEHYRCEGHSDGPCTEWSGKMKSWKQAEMGRCKCNTAECIHWYCDEYKIMVTQGWWYYIGAWIFLIILMGGLLFCAAPFLFTGQWLPAGGLGVLLLILLYFTFHGLGVWGFLFIGSPFAAIAAFLYGFALLNKAAGSVAPLEGSNEGAAPKEVENRGLLESPPLSAGSG